MVLLSLERSHNPTPTRRNPWSTGRNNPTIPNARQIHPAAKIAIRFIALYERQFPPERIPPTYSEQMAFP